MWPYFLWQHKANKITCAFSYVVGVWMLHFPTASWEVVQFSFPAINHNNPSLPGKRACWMLTVIGNWASLRPFTATATPPLRSHGAARAAAIVVAGPEVVSWGCELLSLRSKPGAQRTWCKQIHHLHTILCHQCCIFWQLVRDVGVPEALLEDVKLRSQRGRKKTSSRLISCWSGHPSRLIQPLHWLGTTRSSVRGTRYKTHKNYLALRCAAGQQKL